MGSEIYTFNRKKTEVHLSFFLHDKSPSLYMLKFLPDRKSLINMEWLNITNTVYMSKM